MNDATEERSLADGWDARVRALSSELLSAVPVGAAVMLLDDDQVPVGSLPASRSFYAYSGPAGSHLGPPADADDALERIDAAVELGCGYLAVAWTAAWYRQAYPTLFAHLDESCNVVVADPHVTVYELGGWQTTPSGGRRRKPRFSQHWFAEHIPTWERILASLAGRDQLRALEIGSFEGQATVWLLENVLTADTARIDCVDTFHGSTEHTGMGVDTRGLEARFDWNVSTTGAASKVRKCRGLSGVVLRGLELESYDIAYVDGSHRAADVLEDAVLTFRLVRPGGLVIFDDYAWDERGADPCPLENPRLAIDAFLQIYADRLAVLHRGYQVIIRREWGADS